MKNMYLTHRYRDERKTASSSLLTDYLQLQTIKNKIFPATYIGA